MIRKLIRAGSNYLQSGGLNDNTANDVKLSVLQDLDSVKNVFQEKQEIAVQSTDFYMGRQWTEDQRERIEQQFRYAYVFNEIKDKVDHLLGTQMQTRLDVKVLPREKADRPAAELLNYLIKWAEQVNNVEFLETEICKSGLITGIGIATVRWEMSDMVWGYPKIESVPFNEVYWDGNSRRIDCSDARWQARRTLMRRADARDLYPDCKELIMEAAPQTQYSSSSFDTAIQTNRQKKLSNIDSIGFDWEDKSQIEIIEHFELREVDKFVVVDEIKGTETEFDSLSDAEEYFDGTVTGYMDSDLPEHDLLNPDGSDRVSLQQITTDNAWMTVLIGGEVAIHQQTPLTFLPFVICFCNFFDGEYSGFVEQLIPPQILLNRSFSQLDYAMGASAKQAVTVVPQMLIDKTKAGIQAVGNELSKTAPFIPVASHEALRFHANQPVNPELFSNIQFSISRIEAYSGGKNALGRTESAAESGRAVIARAEAGGVSKLPIFDNLRLWRKTITEHLMWYIKNYMEAGQIVNIIGLDEKLQYVQIDDGVIDSIREMRGDVTVDEAVKSESVRARQFEQLVQFAQVAQIPGEKILPALMELSELSASTQDDVKVAVETWNEYEQKKMQQEQQSKEQQQVESQLRKEQLKAELQQAQGIKDQQEQELKMKDVQMELSKIQKAKMEAENAKTFEDRVNAVDNLPPSAASSVSNQASLT